jgi:hypothetical protein
VLSRPPDLIGLLASSLPQQSVFFINYILVVGAFVLRRTSALRLRCSLTLLSLSSGLGRAPFKLIRYSAFFKLYSRLFWLWLQGRTAEEVRCWLLSALRSDTIGSLTFACVCTTK